MAHVLKDWYFKVIIFQQRNDSVCGSVHLKMGPVAALKQFIFSKSQQVVLVRSLQSYSLRVTLNCNGFANG